MTDYTPGPWKVYHQLLRPQFPGHKIIEVQNLDGGPVIPWAGELERAALPDDPD